METRAREKKGETERGREKREERRGRDEEHPGIQYP